MSKSVKKTAEEKYAAILKTAEIAKSEREMVDAKRLKHIAKLRALRLAKEAADAAAE